MGVSRAFPPFAAALALGLIAYPAAPSRSQSVAGDSIFITGAHGDVLVPVHVVARRDSVTATGTRATWKGDTLSTRTPVMLIVRGATPLTVHALDPRRQVRVTMPAGHQPTPPTRTGTRVSARRGHGGWSFSAAH